MREQHLRDQQLDRSKRGVVRGHQPPLSHRGGRLLSGNRRWAFAQREPLHARGNRARRDENELIAPRAELSHFSRQLLKPGGLKALAARRDQLAADFDDDSAGRPKHFLTH